MTFQSGQDRDFDIMVNPFQRLERLLDGITNEQVTRNGIAQTFMAGENRMTPLSQGKHGQMGSVSVTPEAAYIGNGLVGMLFGQAGRGRMMINADGDMAIAGGMRVKDDLIATKDIRSLGRGNFRRGVTTPAAGTMIGDGEEVILLEEYIKRVIARTKAETRREQDATITEV